MKTLKLFGVALAAVMMTFSAQAAKTAKAVVENDGETLRFVYDGKPTRYRIHPVCSKTARSSSAAQGRSTTVTRPTRPTCALTAPSGKTFAGWKSSKNGRLYADRLLVFDLAAPDETVTMTAVWK